MKIWDAIDGRGLLAGYKRPDTLTFARLKKNFVNPEFSPMTISPWNGDHDDILYHSVASPIRFRADVLSMTLNPNQAHTIITVRSLRSLLYIAKMNERPCLDREST